MSSSSMSTVPRPGPSVLLSFPRKLPSRYPLPQTGVRPEVAGQRWASRLQRRRRRRAGLVLATGHHLVMLSTHSDGGPPGGRRKAPGVLVAAALSVMYWASLRLRALSRHASRSLRRGSARRSRKGTGRLGGSGAVGDVLVQSPSQGVIPPRFPLHQTGVRPEVAEASSVVL